MAIQAQIVFSQPGTGKPEFIIHPHGEAPTRKGSFAAIPVTIGNARTLPTPPEIEVQGFQLVQSDTNIPEFASDDEIREIGYPEITAAILSVTGARTVRIFDHTVRTSAPSSGSRGTASHAHNDYTPKSFAGKLASLNIDPGDNRVIELNAWRPLSEPVVRSPLALADARTIRPEDMIECALVYPDRRGEIYELAHAPGQRWFFYPEMCRNELLIFKGFDSDATNSVPFCPHTAFEHPDEKPGDPPRRSVEFRAAVIF